MKTQLTKWSLEEDFSSFLSHLVQFGYEAEDIDDVGPIGGDDYTGWKKDLQNIYWTESDIVAFDLLTLFTIFKIFKSFQS